jgi:hypothetical protein
MLSAASACTLALYALSSAAAALLASAAASCLAATSRAALLQATISAVSLLRAASKLPWWTTQRLEVHRDWVVNMIKANKGVIR